MTDFAIHLLVLYLVGLTGTNGQGSPPGTQVCNSMSSPSFPAPVGRCLSSSSISTLSTCINATAVTIKIWSGDNNCTGMHSLATTAPAVCNGANGCYLTFQQFSSGDCTGVPVVTVQTVPGYCLGSGYYCDSQGRMVVASFQAPSCNTIPIVAVTQNPSGCVSFGSQSFKNLGCSGGPTPPVANIASTGTPQVTPPPGVTFPPDTCNSVDINGLATPVGVCFQSNGQNMLNECTGPGSALTKVYSTANCTGAPTGQGPPPTFVCAGRSGCYVKFQAYMSPGCTGIPSSGPMWGVPGRCTGVAFYCTSVGQMVIAFHSGPSGCNAAPTSVSMQDANGCVNYGGLSYKNLGCVGGPTPPAATPVSTGSPQVTFPPGVTAPPGGTLAPGTCNSVTESGIPYPENVCYKSVISQKDTKNTCMGPASAVTTVYSSANCTGAVVQQSSASTFVCAGTSGCYVKYQSYTDTTCSGTPSSRGPFWAVPGFCGVGTTFIYYCTAVGQMVVAFSGLNCGPPTRVVMEGPNGCLNLGSSSYKNLGCVGGPTPPAATPVSTGSPQVTFPPGVTAPPGGTVQPGATIPPGATVPGGTTASGAPPPMTTASGSPQMTTASAATQTTVAVNQSMITTRMTQANTTMGTMGSTIAKSAPVKVLHYAVCLMTMMLSIALVF